MTRDDDDHPGERLREEIRRIYGGHGAQTLAARDLEISPANLHKYVSDAVKPGYPILRRLGELGFDVAYILTGERNTRQIPEQTKELDRLRHKLDLLEQELKDAVFENYQLKRKLESLEPAPPKHSAPVDPLPEIIPGRRVVLKRQPILQAAATPLRNTGED